MPDAVSPFDRQLLRRRRDRAAANFADHAFLLDHAIAELAERLADISRTFSRVLVLGSYDGRLKQLFRKPTLLVEADLSEAMKPGVVADEEFLPFRREAFDLVISPLSLHWTNDLPGALLQIKQVLAPDGLFLGTLLGGETLWQLRRVLLEAESVATGGASPRVSPFADLRDMGGLMQRAGFALPVVDSDKVTVTYADLFALLRDLRGMGATNVLAGMGQRPLSRRTLFLAAENYAALFGENGRIPATFEFIHIAGWAPHASQQQPLKPGSAQHRLADALGTIEFPAGDKAGH